MKKRIYNGKNGLEIINSKRVMPNYVCDCPLDEDGNVVDDLDSILIEDHFEMYDDFDEEGNLKKQKKPIFTGKKSSVKKDQWLKKKQKEKKRAESVLKDISDRKQKIQDLKNIEWDKAKIADVRKAIKFLLGVE